LHLEFLILNSELNPRTLAAFAMPTHFSPEELSRYSRQLLLPGVGVEGQARLRDARVLLIGLGGLGSPTALYLAAAGVGTLGLADPDNLELHNLHRQVLHDTIHIGTPKTISARERLAGLNPEIRLREHIDGFSAANARELAEEYDLIVDGADNFSTRYLANDVAVLARRPLVHGSIMRFEGQVAVFAPARGGPCYRCLFPEMPAPGEVPDCSEAGVFGALCGLIGSLMAMEALKLILNVGEPLIGRMMVYDALGATPRVIRLKADPHCPACGAQPDARIAALEPSLYNWQCETRPARRKSSNTNERFLRDLHALRSTKSDDKKPAGAKRDTNENFLRDMNALRGSKSSDANQPSTAPRSQSDSRNSPNRQGVNQQSATSHAQPSASPMPSSSALPFDPANPPLEIGVEEAHAWLESAEPPLVLDVREPFEVSLCRLDGSATIPLAEVPARLADLPRDRAILVHCHHGGRSLQAAKFLRAKGFPKAVNLRGGIHQWAEAIDSAMARY
jgi:adenylyltransferase/sulfurtransferase